MRTIFGITFGEKNLKSFKEHFTLVRDLDENCFYETKKVFHHEEEGLTFDYKYVVEVGCIDDEDGLRMYINLYLAPTFNSLCDKTKLEMVSVWGVDSLEELAENNWDISSAEVAEEGYGICFGSKSFDAPNGWKDFAESLLDDIASVYEIMDNFRGFYIDKKWNRIGTTGWDILKHDLCGEQLFKF